MTSRQTINFALILSILVLASSVSILSTDIYAPSLPHLPSELSTTAAMAKLTIGLNVAMFSLGQLFLGPLSDRFGRRPVLLSSMLVFSLASLLCGLSLSIDQLIAARMLQGLSGSAEAVICMAIFKDLFDEKQQVRGLAIFGMSIALAPAVGPLLGGYIHVLFGWRFNFWLVTALGCIACFMIWRYLPESSTPDRDAIKARHVVHSYSGLLRNTPFMNYALLAGICMAIIYAFVTGAPFILIDQMGVKTQHFGYHQMAIVSTYFIGSMASTRLVDRMSTQQLMNVGVYLLLLGGLILLSVSSLELLNPISFSASFAVMTLGMGPIFAVAPARAMLSAKGKSGYAAALLGGTEMAVASFAAALVVIFHDGSARPVIVSVLTMMMLTIVLWRNAIRYQERTL
jgi:DHA1 family bicyclomycin/chloramphenicol resistance-like MFS transporter